MGQRQRSVQVSSSEEGVTIFLGWEEAGELLGYLTRPFDAKQAVVDALEAQLEENGVYIELEGGLS